MIEHQIQEQYDKMKEQVYELRKNIHDSIQFIKYTAEDYILKKLVSVASTIPIPYNTSFTILFLLCNLTLSSHGYKIVNMIFINTFTCLCNKLGY